VRLEVLELALAARRSDRNCAAPPAPANSSSASGLTLPSRASVALGLGGALLLRPAPGRPGPRRPARGRPAPAGPAGAATRRGRAAPGRAPRRCGRRAGPRSRPAGRGDLGAQPVAVLRRGLLLHRRGLGPASRCSSPARAVSACSSACSARTRAACGPLGLGLGGPGGGTQLGQLGGLGGAARSAACRAARAASTSADRSRAASRAAASSVGQLGGAGDGAGQLGLGLVDPGPHLQVRRRIGLPADGPVGADEVAGGGDRADPGVGAHERDGGVEVGDDGHPLQGPGQRRLQLVGRLDQVERPADALGQLRPAVPRHRRQAAGDQQPGPAAVGLLEVASAAAASATPETTTASAMPPSAAATATSAPARR
jgi:hypothetical protein